MVLTPLPLFTTPVGANCNLAGRLVGTSVHTIGYSDSGDVFLFLHVTILHIRTWLLGMTRIELRVLWPVEGGGRPLTRSVNVRLARPHFAPYTQGGCQDLAQV